MAVLAAAFTFGRQAMGFGLDYEGGLARRGSEIEWRCHMLLTLVWGLGYQGRQEVLGMSMPGRNMGYGTGDIR